MYYFQHLKVRQIADILKLDESTVKSRLFQGRKKLKIALSDFYYSTSKVPAIFIGYNFIGTLINGSFGEVASASCGVVSFPKKLKNTNAIAGGVAATVIAIALGLGGFFVFGGSNVKDNKNSNSLDNQTAIINSSEEDEQKNENPDNGDENQELYDLSIPPAKNASLAHVVVDENNFNEGISTEENKEEEIEVTYITLNRVIYQEAYQIFMEEEYLNKSQLDHILSLPGLNPIIEVAGSGTDYTVSQYYYGNWWWHHHHHNHGDGCDKDNIDHTWYYYYMLFWDTRFDFAYSQIDEDSYEYTYSLIKFDNPDSLLNIDIDGDGKADLNIDIDDDGLPELNIDIDGDRKADLNIDTDNDGYPEINIDSNGDWIADLNLV